MNQSLKCRLADSLLMQEEGRYREERILSYGYSGLNYKGGVIGKPATNSAGPAPWVYHISL
ncbi:hypothetical protein SHVI106290_04125 [Shewanella violacea]